jgi:hypothetical protein
MLKDRFFWTSYGKYTAAVIVGLALATFLLGVPEEVTIRLGVGAILGFPAAFGFAMRRPPRNTELPHS